jgi:acetoacetyl-CoA synthetase
MDDAALYDRKTIDLRPKIAAIAERMETVPEFKDIVSFPRFSTAYDISHIGHA